jgi:hypothetical protein
MCLLLLYLRVWESVCEQLNPLPNKPSSGSSVLERLAGSTMGSFEGFEERQPDHVAGPSLGSFEGFEERQPDHVAGPSSRSFEGFEEQQPDCDLAKYKSSRLAAW